MKFGMALGILIALGFAIFAGVGLWRIKHLLPHTSNEIVVLSPEKRESLERLRDENKFGPNNYPPLGYTGCATPEEQVTASAAVNKVIDTILLKSDGRLPAKMVSKLIGNGMQAVDLLETEDRERTQGYMIEIWYLAGFKGATGLFVYGAYFKAPPGYGEPLPPGWTSPEHPRPIF